MTNDLIAGSASKYRSGYQWVRTFPYEIARGQVELMGRINPTPTWFLVPKNPFGRDELLEVPLQTHGTHFREFAELGGHRERILKFADAFGTIPEAQYTVNPPQTNMDKLPRGLHEVGRVPLGIAIEQWTRASEDLKRAVHIWDLCTDGKYDDLSKCFRWVRKPSINQCGWYYVGPPDAKHERGGEEVIRLKTDWMEMQQDVFLVATFAVQQWINRSIKNKVNAQLDYDVAKGEQVFRLIPQGLVTAMWLQFAHAITGNKVFRTCPICGRYFEVSFGTKGHTERKVYCDGKCKTRAARRREAEAHAQVQKGKSASEIAKSIDTDVNTVKRWLKKANLRKNNGKSKSTNES